MCCGLPKGTSQAEATSNSEKIKLVALSVIELCLSEGIRQSVENSVKYNFLKILYQLFESVSGQSESLLGLHNGYFTLR